MVAPDLGLPMNKDAADKARCALPALGFGLGLRNVHFEHILSQWPDIDWFEAISENFMDSGGRPIYVLDQIAERYPIVLHGVSLSIGSTDPLNQNYLKKLKTLAKRVEARWVSDHLCWTGILGANAHDLLPLPLTDESLTHVISRIGHVQDYLERPLILENPSTYLEFEHSHISEPDYLRALSDATGCGFLLDVNNVFVTCYNSGIDPYHYLDAFPLDKVVQFHLAGHENCGTHIIDTHEGPVSEAVWKLYHYACQRVSGRSTLLEWDSQIPDFETCRAELSKAKTLLERTNGFDNSLPSKPHKSSPDDLSTPLDFLMPDVMSQLSEAEL